MTPEDICVCSLGCGVLGWAVGVWGWGFGVWGCGFGVRGLGFAGRGVGCGVEGLGSGRLGYGRYLCVLKRRAQGLEMRVAAEKKKEPTRHSSPYSGPGFPISSSKLVKSFSAFSSSLGSIIKNQGLAFQFSGFWSWVPGVALLRFRVSALRC